LTAVHRALANRTVKAGAKGGRKKGYKNVNTITIGRIELGRDRQFDLFGEWG